MSDPDLVRQAWQASATDPVLPDLDAVRADADRFLRRSRRYNAADVVALVAGAIFYLPIALFNPFPVFRIGALLFVLGCITSVWHLRRFISAMRPREEEAAQPMLVRQRAQLARRLDARRGLVVRMLLPPVPGILVVAIGFTLRAAHSGLPYAVLRIWIIWVFMVAAFAYIWFRNRRRGAKMRKLIDDIDALIGGKE